MENTRKDDLHEASVAASSGSLPSIAGSGRNVAANLLRALHSVFEDLKLNLFDWHHIPRMAVLMYQLSSHIAADEWKACFPALQTMYLLVFA